MPRPTMPIRRLLGVSATLLVATPGSSLASEAGALQHAGGASTGVDEGIRTTATGCGKGTGGSSNPHGQRCVEVTASGFLGGELVLIHEFRRPGWQLTVRADGFGRVGYRLSPAAASTSKADVLTFVGLGAASAAGTSGTVQVSVPRTAIYRFGAGS